VRPAPAIAILAALLTTPVAAQQPMADMTSWILPPERYDHPYKGHLTLQRATDEEMIKTCPAPLTLPKRIACAFPIPAANSCLIVLAPRTTIAAAGYSEEIVIRHEIGHCNGWPADHNGARRLKDEGRFGS
jgi:hypothetical protein